MVKLRRIPHPRTRVNKGAPGLSAPLSVAFFSKVQGLRVRLDDLPVVLLGGLQDALPRGPLRAEGCHKRAVLAAQHHYVRVRLLQIVVELGEQWLLLHALSCLLRRVALRFHASKHSVRGASPK